MKFKNFFILVILFYSCNHDHPSQQLVSIPFPTEWRVAHQQFENAGYLMQYELSIPLLSGNRKNITQLQFVDFPIQVEIDAKSGRSVLLYPPFDLFPAGAIAPWDFQSNIEKNKKVEVLNLTSQKGWLAFILGLAETGVSFAQLNYPRAKLLVEKKMKDKALSSSFFLDSNRVLRDLGRGQFSSFSIREKKCFQWSLSLQFKQIKGNWYIGSLGVPLTDQVFQDGVLLLPAGITLLFNPQAGKVWSVYYDKKKQPPLIVESCSNL